MTYLLMAMLAVSGLFELYHLARGHKFRPAVKFKEILADESLSTDEKIRRINVSGVLWTIFRSLFSILTMVCALFTPAALFIAPVWIIGLAKGSSRFLKNSRTFFVANQLVCAALFFAAVWRIA
jgi:hypothetical protein